MKLLPTIIFLCILVATYAQSNRLKVSIYYESLCIDSITFIKQLYTCYPKIKNYVYLEFVPFGKVDVSLVNGSYVYNCQHGQDECYGNRMHACALAQTQNQTVALEFINCVMSAPNITKSEVSQRTILTTTIYECAITYGLSWDNIEKCESCMEGQRLFLYNGYRTRRIVPNIQVVPTIVFNDRYDVLLQEKAIVDFCTTTTTIIQYLISIYYQYPSCRCPDLYPLYPTQCCGYQSWPYGNYPGWGQQFGFNLNCCG